MKELLFHVSDKKMDVLRPMQIDNYEECICFSLGCFISNFGQWIYIFDFETLNQNFSVQKVSTSGLYQEIRTAKDYKFHFSSQPLGHEYRIYQPISIEQFCIGIAQHFNHAKGRLSVIFRDTIMKQYQTELLYR